MLVENNPGTESRGATASFLAEMTKELAALEKRDWELWVILSIAGATTAIGFLALIFPSAFLNDRQLHFEITISRQLFLALLAFLALINVYLLARRFQVRRLREQVISRTLQGELVRLQSFIDPLTEVYNRRSLEETAGRFISHARRQKKPLTVALVDIDDFKQVNTRHGHLTGDFVLAEVAKLLKDAVRGSDAVIRYGGDEFVIILADSTKDAARTICARLNRSIDDWNRAEHVEGFTLSVSIGLAEFADGSSLDEVLDAADSDMYAEKQSRGERTSRRGMDCEAAPSAGRR